MVPYKKAFLQRSGSIISEYISILIVSHYSFTPGKTLTELYDELRDNSLSKALVLTNAIRDRSLADVEPQLAFGSRYYQYIMPKGTFLAYLSVHSLIYYFIVALNHLAFTY